MKVFFCDHCGNLSFFENVQCVKCQHTLGFLPDVRDLSALEPTGQGAWRALARAARGRLYRSCANSLQYETCNWLIPTDDQNPLCVSCRLNDTIPDLSMPGNRELWSKFEQAKRRVIYSLLRLRLPTDAVAAQNRPGLRFRFLADLPGGPINLTGHENGLITLNIAEADDVERERRRVNLNEPFRTLLGHMRHEVAHYYWDRLIANGPRLQQFRQTFGDESQDYNAALQRHYQQGAPFDWPTRFVSAYASAHPWEDWAETWAHYLHMSDTLETAGSLGMSLHPRHPDAESMTSDPIAAKDPRTSFENLIAHWLPLTLALNELNRGMGHSDLYPFVLSGPAMEKLRFVHEVIAAKEH
jgi:hypothetical protein